MRAPGFTFPCLEPASTEDKKFQWFMETAKKEPNKIYNPWPQIVGYMSFYQARTQPLIRTSYLPTSDPYRYGFVPTSDPLCSGIVLEEQLTHNHEAYHLYNDLTPAKMFARLLLRDALYNLWSLLNSPTWDSTLEKLWNALVKNYIDLSNICRAITLSEELLATTASIEFSRLSATSVDLEVLSKKEREITTTHAKMSPYYEAFKKAAQWAHDTDTLDTWLATYLQGIKFCRQRTSDKLGMRVVDSEKRCRILTEKVNAMSNGDELRDWLIRMTHEGKEILAFLTARQLLANRKNFFDIDNLIWTLIGGRAEDVNPTFDSVYYCSKNIAHAVLYPARLCGKWYIINSISHVRHDKSVIQEKALKKILGYASLLEQLCSGNGICCPHYNPCEGCVCDLSWNESLNHIARWARKGKFDQGRSKPGNWRELPQECRIAL